MKELAREIRAIVDRNSGRLARLKPDEVSSKATPDDWCRKEILGHLIDSAANNHQRFVRACLAPSDDVIAYRQNDWVRIQGYDEADWGGLVELWSAYNRHLSHLVERIPEASAGAPCHIGLDHPVSLEWVVKDYLRHLRHHLSDLLPRDPG
ncbi:MAG: DinB family protein [Deferrisomatales bacterium]